MNLSLVVVQWLVRFAGVLVVMVPASELVGCADVVNEHFGTMYMFLPQNKSNYE